MLIDDLDFLVNHCLARMEEEGEEALDLVCAEFPDMADELRAEVERRRARKPAMRRPDDPTQVSMAIPENPPWMPATPGQQEEAPRDSAATVGAEDRPEPPFE